MATSVGIDIGTYAIKAVELDKKGSTLQVVWAALVPNSTGVVVPVQQKDRDTLVEQLKNVCKEFKITTQRIHIGLPESLLSTKIISIPPLSDAELASAIGWQAEQYIPIPSDDLQLEYQVLYRPPKQRVSEQMRVLLLGASKKIVQGFSSVFDEAQLEVVTLETQMLGLYRLLMQDPNIPTTLLVHFGASAMDMVVVHEKELAFVYTYPNGGVVLSRAIERGLGLDPMQAEEYKRTYGLDPTQLEGKVQQTLAPIFQTFVAEIQKALQYFSGSHQGAQVKRILISGGSAALPNLIPSLVASFPFEVSMLSPFSSLTFAPGVQISQLDIPAYSVAVGLAAGGFSA